ncbi:glycosyltransferase [Pleurocapsa sp. PCC 7319]|uniref:glycosyltransferase n=1 Tax=Pleurocapsa sp. PCC 7319 TaxID=118161 RepID=UPI00034CE1FC|nr:glycosyltransferase [Pleurocapsa sp. PCC 7319]
MIINAQEDNIHQKIGYLQNKAIANQKEGNLKEAIAYYLEVIKLDDNQPTWLYSNVIHLLAQLERFKEGLEQGNKALIRHPESEELHRAIGLVYEKQQNTINCIEKYRKAISLEPKQPDWLYCNLAKQLLKQEQLEEVVDVCYQGLELYSNFYPLHYVLGKTYALQEKWERAILSYRRVQELYPDWLEVEQKINQLIYKKSQTERFINHQNNKIKLLLENFAANIIDKKINNTNNHLEIFKDLDVNLLFAELRKEELDVISCNLLLDSFRDNFLDNKSILNYGCWLSPSILYLEVTVDSCLVFNKTTILVCSERKYAVAQANFFQITDRQVAGVACFAKNLYLENEDSYRICIDDRNSPIVIEGKVSQKSYSLEFIEHLKIKPNEQQNLIRESLSNSVIKLIPQNHKLEAGNLLRKLQHFIDIPASNYVEPNLPFKIFIDYIIPLKYDGLFISGWLHDPYQMLEKITAISALGFSFDIPSQDIYRLERQDVNTFVQNTRYGDFEEKLGFCSYITVSESIRQSIQDFADLHSFRFLIRLRGNIEVEIVPDVKYSDFYNARKQLMQIANPNKVSEQMLTNCIAPAGYKLQQLCIEQVRIRDVTVIGKPIAQPLVSIVIPLYRRLDFIKVQLATMANDPAIKQCEIIYVLDSPEQEEELRTLLLNHCILYQLPIKLVVMERNSGYAAANNAGVCQAAGEYLVLLNSDVFPKAKGWMLEMAKFYQSSPKIGTLGTKLIYEDGSLQHAGMFFAQTIFPFWITLHYYKGLPGNYSPAQKSRAVPTVTGACLMIRQELYDRVGGLTTDYIIGDFEDSDLCLKCRELGYESWYFADTTLYHLERQSVPLNSSYNNSLAWRLNGNLHHQRWGEQIARLMSIHQ